MPCVFEGVLRVHVRQRGHLRTACASRLCIVEGVLHAHRHRGCMSTRASCVQHVHRGCTSRLHGVFCMHICVEAVQGVLQVHMSRLWEERAKGERVEGGALKRSALKGSESKGSTLRGKGEHIKGFHVER
jgi:hypothetical protein